VTGQENPPPLPLFITQDLQIDRAKAIEILIWLLKRRGPIETLLFSVWRRKRSLFTN